MYVKYCGSEIEKVRIARLKDAVHRKDAAALVYVTLKIWFPGSLNESGGIFISGSNLLQKVIWSTYRAATKVSI